MMNWAFEYHHQEKFLKIIVNGVFSVDECIRMREEFLEFDFWLPGTNLFLDYREADLSSIGMEHQRALSEHHIANKTRFGRGKIAFLVKSVRDFGLGRQYEIITEDQVLSMVMVFQDEKEANRWLACRS